MKSKHSFLSGLAALVILGAVPPCGAQAPFWVGDFAGTSTDQNRAAATNSYFVVPRLAGDLHVGAHAQLQFVSATSDVAGSLLTIYECGTPATLTAYNVLTCTVANASYTFTNNDVVVINDVSADPSVATAYHYASVAKSGTNWIQLTVAPSFTPVSGDAIYEATSVGSIPVGAATVTINAAPSRIWRWPDASKPGLMVISGDAACQINAAAGEYRKR